MKYAHTITYNIILLSWYYGNCLDYNVIVIIKHDDNLWRVLKAYRTISPTGRAHSSCIGKYSYVAKISLTLDIIVFLVECSKNFNKYLSPKAVLIAAFWVLFMFWPFLFIVKRYSVLCADLKPWKMFNSIIVGSSFKTFETILWYSKYCRIQTPFLLAIRIPIQLKIWVFILTTFK